MNAIIWLRSIRIFRKCLANYCIVAHLLPHCCKELLLLLLLLLIVYNFSGCHKGKRWPKHWHCWSASHTSLILFLMFAQVRAGMCGCLSVSVCLWINVCVWKCRYICLFYMYKCTTLLLVYIISDSSVWQPWQVASLTQARWEQNSTQQQLAIIIKTFILWVVTACLLASFFLLQTFTKICHCFCQLVVHYLNTHAYTHTLI